MRAYGEPGFIFHIRFDSSSEKVVGRTRNRVPVRDEHVGKQNEDEEVDN